MIIDNFKKEYYGDDVRISVYLLYDNNTEYTILWFEFERKYEKYFSNDRIDGIVVMLLFELMRKGENIYSNFPISDRLHFTLDTLIEKLAINSSGYLKKIKIFCPLTDEKYDDNCRKNALGMSFGVDSLYSYYRYHDKKLNSPNYVADLVTYFNHGSLNGEYKNSQKEMRRLYMENKQRIIEFSNHEKVQALFVDSNIDELCSINYTNTHSYRTAGIVLLFQKLIKNYYFSSAGEEVFEINPLGESGKYDIFILPNVQTESTYFFSSGIEKNRFEKTKFIANFDYTKQILSVCWRGIDNCGSCPKCIRTLATLEILGCLKEYKDIFDIDAYYKNYIWNWAKIVSLVKKDYFYKEIYDHAKEYDFKINKYSILLSKIFIISRLIFKPKFLNKFQNIIKK